MNQADAIIQVFGGLTKTARALGHKHCTTVQGWRKSGNIPDWRKGEILQAADQAGVRHQVETILEGCAA